MDISLRRRHALLIKDGAFSHKINYIKFFFGYSKPQRASKLLHWFKSYGTFGERRDFTYWWSCIGKGLRLQLAQQTGLKLM